IKFPDALSGSYLAYTNGAPIVYQNPEGLQDGPTEFILSNVKPGGTVYIMGLEIPTSIEQTFTDAGLEVKRLGGATRIETNLDALQETGVPDDCLFIASAGNFPDAMCASACGIPIMLTYESLKDSQLAFIESLGKKLDIYVAGGPAAVTDQVLGQLEPYANSIKRLSGSTRFTTATAIAEEVFSDVAYNQVVVTEGNGYVDGLAASQLAAALGVPMILAANDTKVPAIDFVADHNILNGYFAASWSLLSDETAREIMGIYDTISGTYQDGTYRLRCAANERYTMTMERNSADNGVNLRLERFAGSAQQAFTLSRIDRGIMIAPVVSGKAIDINGGTMAEGTRLLQYQYTNGLNQKWEAVANSDGTFSFRSIKNGNYYITVNDTTAASSQMGIHTWYNDERNAYQKFVLEIVDAKRTMPNGMFILATASDHSKVIEVANKAKTNGANIQLGNLGDTNAQKFNLNYLGDGYYQIVNVRSNRVIDIQGGNATPGTNVQQYGWDGGNYQRWAFSYNQFGYNICSGLGTVLDCKGGSTAAGTNIQSYRPNDTIAQCFVPIPTQPSYEKSYLVAIDAGHQRTQNRGTEPNGPGSSVMKQKVTSGTHGNWSGLDEYVLNLQVALKLQAELQNRGYDVFMVRTTHDVNISNAERAQMATAAGA
ncbi:MAG: RICIN domain-containing protein, partial [Lachnospiraceae bacterium]|nr:RICIN domain-containing protein [Candidatus Equihabitans merdae]